MPAILRNSLPNLYPLIAIIRPYAQNDVVGVRRAGSATLAYGSNGMWVCNIMPWGRRVYSGVAVAFGPVYLRYLLRMYWA